MEEVTEVDILNRNRNVNISIPITIEDVRENTPALVLSANSVSGRSIVYLFPIPSFLYLSIHI